MLQHSSFQSIWTVDDFMSKSDLISSYFKKIKQVKSLELICGVKLCRCPNTSGPTYVSSCPLAAVTTNWVLVLLNDRVSGPLWGRTRCQSSLWWPCCPSLCWLEKPKWPMFSREWAVCTPPPSTCCSWGSLVSKSENYTLVYFLYLTLCPQAHKSAWFSLCKYVLYILVYIVYIYVCLFF